MRVYHFLNRQYGLDDLRKKRLKIAKVMGLNDPFELLGINLSNFSLRKIIKNIKKDFSKKYGIICFSKSWNSPVQWAHYSDNHKGICIGFDIPDSQLIRVKYVKSRLNPPTTINEKFIQKLLSTKFSHWSYEEEYREIVPLTEKIDGFYFKKFSDDLVPKQIIIGAMSNISRAELDQALGSLIHKIEIIKARPAFRSFKIVRQRKKELWI